jgi:L-fucose isomerase
VWPFINSVGRDLPILALSNNNGKKPGNVGLLATDGSLRQAGIRTHRIVGKMDDEVTQKKVIDWIRGSEAVTTIQNEVYGLYGGPSMGMDTGYFQLTPTINTLGTSVRQIDQYLLIKTIEKEVDEREVEKGLNWFKNLLGDRLLFDNKVLTDNTLKNQIRLYLAMEIINKEKGFDYCGLKGQRELTENFTLGDVPEMLMNDPYDWRGSKEPFVCATEADSNAAITMQLLKYISGGLPILFMDIRLYHPEDDIWDMCNSGNHASYYANLSFEPEENFKKISFHPALEYYFKAGGASVEFDAAATELTFARLGFIKERAYMVIIPGRSLELSPEKRKKLNKETDPTWPHVHARLDCNFDDFIDVFPANHIHAVQGNRVTSLKYMCEIAGIKPIILDNKNKKYSKPVWEIIK